MTVHFVTKLQDNHVDPMSIKIGHSRSLTQRISDLQTGYPLRLILMGKIQMRDLADDRKIASTFHRQFQSNSNHREWLVLSQIMD